MKIPINGASGMVGEGVLRGCLQSADITEILVLGRKACGVLHPKPKEILHGDFLNLAPIGNELLKIFKNAYMFHPDAMSAVKGQKNIKLVYKLFVPIIPIVIIFFPKSVCTLYEVGRTMLTFKRTHPQRLHDASSKAVKG